MLFVGFAVGCTKDAQDEVSPEIQSLAVSVNEAQPGDVIDVDVAVTDNEALNQLRIRISPAFTKSFGEWEALKIRSISGISYAGTFSFIVPDTALAGYYQIATQVADMDGNGSIDSLMYVTLLQPGDAPQLIDFNTDPALIQDTLPLTNGDTLTFSGSAIDDIALQKVSIILRDENEASLQSLQYTIADTTATWFVDESAGYMAIHFEKDTPAELMIKILDSDGNQTRIAFPVVFTP